jgi:hypothetical protein
VAREGRFRLQMHNRPLREVDPAAAAYCKFVAKQEAGDYKINSMLPVGSTDGPRAHQSVAMYLVSVYSRSPS